MGQLIPSPPWPRSWYNYPIILCGIVLQFVWAFSLVWDYSVLDITAVAPLMPYLHPGQHQPLSVWLLAFILTITGTISIFGFFVKKKINTLYALLPQQFIMCVSSFGAIHSMISGHFADGTARSQAFLFADQSPILLLTIFHTWAMVLILMHAGDEE